MADILIPKRLVGLELINLAAGQGKVFADLCEQQYAKRVDSMASAVLDSGCAIVMIAGPSASGKTTSANKLAARLNRRGTAAKVISLDDFYRDPETYPRLADGSKDYENVMALDIDCVHHCLRNLAQSGECDVPEFDFVTEHRKKEYRHLKREGGVVIVEGIHALNPLLSGNLERRSVYRIYAGLREEYCGPDGRRMLPTRNLRLARRMIRDYKFRGHAPQTTLALWDRVCEGENRYIRVFKQDADYVMDTSFSYEVCLFAGQVRSWQREFPPEALQDPELVRLFSALERFEPLPAELMPEDSMLHEFFG